MAEVVEAASTKEAITEVAREHGYERLKEEQLLAIYKFVIRCFCIAANGVWEVTNLQTTTVHLRSPQRVQGSNVSHFSR